MNKLIKTTVGVAIAVGLASTAFATQNDGGLYIGAKVGYNKMDVPTGDFTVSGASLNGKTDKYVGNIHVGYLMPVADQFQLGGQLGYSRYGQYKVTASGADAFKDTISSFNILAVGQWNIEQWFVQGRLGMGRFLAHDSGDASSVAGTNFQNKWIAIAGLSGGYFFSENLSGEVFYDHSFGKNLKASNMTETSQNKMPTMNSIGIGLTYSF